MWALFQATMMGMAGSLVARALTSLGIGLVSYAGLNSLTSTVVSNVNNSMSGMSGLALALIVMSGFMTSVSIITSALVTRTTLIAIKRFIPS